jgi:hypothetical protein
MPLLFTELMRGAGLVVKMSSDDFKKIAKLAEKWGLSIHMEADQDTNEIIYSIKNTLFTACDMTSIEEWIIEEFEEK